MEESIIFTTACLQAIRPHNTNLSPMAYVMRYAVTNDLGSEHLLSSIPQDEHHTAHMNRKLMYFCHVTVTPL